MESCCSGSGKSSGFSGIVPGSFQKVPEEFQNGPEVKIYIWEVVIRSPEKFGGIPVLYRGHRRGSGGPPGGVTSLGGPHGP